MHLVLKNLFLFILAVPLLGAAFAPHKPERHTVVIESMKYAPSEIRISVNDSIRWMNKDLVPHTVTSLDKKFDSKEIPSHGRWTYVFRKPGTYPYKCDYHPMMSGTVIVEDRKH